MLLSADAALPQIFDRLAELLSAFVDASIVQIAIDGDPEPRIAYIFRDGSGGPPEDPTVIPDGASGRVLRSGSAIVYGSVDQWPAARIIAVEGAEPVRAVSAIFVPIPFGGRAVGVLSVQSVKPDAYDDEDRSLLETCALYLGARINDERQREANEALRGSRRPTR